jgi:cell division protein FtsL
VSSPARQLAPSPRPRPASPAPSHERARPTRAPAARPLTSSPPSPLRRARRGSTLAFWIFTSLVLGAMVVAIVSVSALGVQSGFQIDALRDRIGALSDEREVLTKEVAELSSPGRVQTWARQAGMVTPDNVVVLRVPPTPEDPAA